MNRGMTGETAVAGEYDFASIGQIAYTKAGCGRNSPFDHIRIVRVKLKKNHQSWVDTNLNIRLKTIWI